MTTQRTDNKSKHQNKQESQHQISHQHLNDAINMLKQQISEYEFAGMHHLKHLL